MARDDGLIEDVYRNNELPTDYFVVASLAHKSKLKTHARKKTRKDFCTFGSS
jgi:hypothetical protein